jgi:hypothetical protein
MDSCSVGGRRCTNMVMSDIFDIDLDAIILIQGLIWEQR